MKTPNAPQPLSFEDAFNALKALPPGPWADESVLQVLSDFVLSLSPEHPSKSSRFERILGLICLNPNLRIPLIDVDPLQGIDPPSDRPIEFALTQYMASGCSANWASCIDSMLASDLFKPAFNRPLTFKKIEVSSLATGELYYTFHRIHAYANGFLRAESAEFPGRAGSHCRRLASRIEDKMSDQAKVACQFENFKLMSFGEMAIAMASTLRQQAERPFAVVTGEEPGDFKETPELAAAAKDFISKSISKIKL